MPELQKCPECEGKLLQRHVSGGPDFCKEHPGGVVHLWKQKFADRGCVTFVCQCCGQEVEAWQAGDGHWEVVVRGEGR
ncbi:MAG: hypothetical protein M0R06_01295 [Sphaerochaeta sp.]|nr:hypothetical protein [Sphaerochaeta sp.]